MGSDVDDVMSYISGMPMIRDLAASLGDPALSERLLTAIAMEYEARASAPTESGSRAAARLVTARRALPAEIRIHRANSSRLSRRRRSSSASSWGRPPTAASPSPV